MQPVEENKALMEDIARDPFPDLYEVKKRAYGKGHVYTIDGEKVARVTNIVRDIVAKGTGFERWMRADTVKGFQALLGNYIGATFPANFTTQTPYELMRQFPKDRSPMDRGTAVHQAIEDGNFDPANFHPDDQGYIRAAAAFHDDNDPQPDEQELIVGSRQYRYAGTLDWRGTLTGKTAILDWKTASRSGTKPYESYHLQIAAYETASIEMGYDPTDEQFIVMLYPDGDYAVFPVVATIGDWLEAVTWWRSLDDLRQRVAA